jgi:hypothetical protein
MAGKGGRRGGDVQLSKTARASLGDKGAAATSDWSKFSCDVCREPIRVKDMVVVRELTARGNMIAHYHATCSGLPGA